MAGALALVVGPSGAGKDTLIAGARAALAHDARFVFVRRMVTRAAVAEAEDHAAVTAEAFAELARGGAFALSWEAHGLSYGLPARVADDVGAGRIAVANASRHAIADALCRFDRVHVLLVEAPASVRAARIAGRGREDPADIAARLTRDVPGLPGGVPVTRIDNSGDVARGVADLVAALRAIADRPAPDGSAGGT